MSPTVSEFAQDLKEIKQARAHIEMSNLFLAIERREVPPTRQNINKVFALIRKSFDRGDFMIEWWEEELEQLDQEINYHWH